MQLEARHVAGFVGGRIHRVWIVWNDTWDEIEQSSPIVVETSRGNLELWAVYVSEFGIGVDSISVARLPANYDGCDLDLVWTYDRLSSQRLAQAALITGLAPCGAGLVVRHSAGAFVGANIGDEMALLEQADLPRGFQG